MASILPSKTAETPHFVEHCDWPLWQTGGFTGFVSESLLVIAATSVAAPYENTYDTSIEIEQSKY